MKIITSSGSCFARTGELGSKARNFFGGTKTFQRWVQRFMWWASTRLVPQKLTQNGRQVRGSVSSSCVENNF